MLEATVADFGYRRRRSTLVDVDVQLSAGRTVLLGPNGAGKTTLLKALAGAVGYRGSLSLDGVAVSPRTRRPETFRRAVGWLPQRVIPFPNLTAREHVAYVGWLKGMRASDAWTRAERALAMVGLTAEGAARAHTLSGGQTRRLGIAGVLVHDARYLLLDEPTAGLDPNERDRLVEVLRSIEIDRAVLVSTHDTDTLIDGESRIHVLVDGRSRFVGPYSSFVSGHEGGSESMQLRQAYAAMVRAD
ncbi:ATP-binding cassette domain-containing protein [Microbacterium sp. TNHR37B]|uniref:ATP-binding cassette domain-containing protein n=1 Tax=Microbacterium sp. TNHR37B TaxID=1775956 RepID=UPI0007B28934|nr:ATP-binding cassette domain-containing protein [Microbacterium sp. TNHR37B]KZE91938.1 Energy-coupling factor transporter ATP-binding protein EcfA1 [Microbacterium sp. TNHR37B]